MREFIDKMSKDKNNIQLSIYFTCLMLLYNHAFIQIKYN